MKTPTVTFKRNNTPAPVQANYAPIGQALKFWHPASGDTQLLYFEEIKTTPVKDTHTGNIVQLECVFLSQPVTGKTKSKLPVQITNSRRLLTLLKANKIPRGTLLHITCLGYTRTDFKWTVKTITPV